MTACSLALPSFRSYNPELSIFGYVRVLWTWNDAGTVETEFVLQGLPAAQYAGDINKDNWRSFVPDLLIVLITLIYLPLTVTDMWMHIRADHRTHAKERQRRKKAGASLTGEGPWRGTAKGRLQLLLGSFCSGAAVLCACLRPMHLVLMRAFCVHCASRGGTALHAHSQYWQYTHLHVHANPLPACHV